MSHNSKFVKFFSCSTITCSKENRYPLTFLFDVEYHFAVS